MGQTKKRPPNIPEASRPGRAIKTAPASAEASNHIPSARALRESACSSIFFLLARERSTTNKTTTGAKKTDDTNVALNPAE